MSERSKDPEPNNNEQYQIGLDILQKDINTVNEQVLNLREHIKNSQEELIRLVKEYQQKRYNRQVEIWAERGLIRCTNCFNTSQRNWGLVPPDDAHYIEVRGKHTHRGDHYGSDSTHSQLEYHRLCTQCYSEKLQAYASDGGGFRGISTEQVDEINTILSSEQDKYKIHDALRKRLGNFNEIRVYWHRLPIPEQAYEIGKPISLVDSNHEKVLRLVQLKT